MAGHWIVLAAQLLFVTGVLCAYEEYAEFYAPRLRFDREAGSSDHCFPGDAADYYERRLENDNSRICNLNYTSIQGGEVPTYWKATVCGYHLHIAYWNFFGYNHDCDCCSGERDAWWESVVVKVRDYDLDERIHEVRFGQKKGWYTRIPGRYEIVNGTHPVAYVGKSSHGYYHDDGGTGTCCYYEDYRDPHEEDQHMDAWLNLQPLDNSSAWMSDPSQDPWNGINSPAFRDDWDLCALNGCEGSNVQLCLTTSGCSKSDIGDDPF